MIQDRSYLEQLPQPALEVRGGVISGMNTAAREQLPTLVPGSPAPDFLTLPLTGEDQTGCFQQQDEIFLFTRLNGPEYQVLLFRTAGQDGLTSAQVEGFSRQMRTQMGLLLNQLQLMGQDPQSDPPALAQLNHSFHQMLRLVNDLEFLNIPLDEARKVFSPTTLDLAGLCRQLCLQTEPLLHAAGVQLHYDAQCMGLLIPGDPHLLRRMLLALISNAAKAARGGSITVQLRERNGKAAVTVSAHGSQPPDLADLLPKEPGHIPTPEEGAGMGLSVARRIAQLHDGNLLSHTNGQDGVSVTAALPIKPLPTGNLSLESSQPELDAGISPVLLELADLLPNSLFQVEDD